MKERDDWWGDALCAQIATDLFFPEKGESAKAARQICGQCPVRVQCLETALGMVENPAGIWGGLSERERRIIRRTAA